MEVLVSRNAWLLLAAGAGALLAGTAVASGPYGIARDDIGERLVCRTFEVDLRDGPGTEGATRGFDTADTAQPIGAWVHEMAERGWRLASVQLTVGQKPTGFPQGYQQVCVTPR
jgi:hypothetical protein